MRDLTGRTAVVTGAASGIGFALATRFVNEGMNVVLADVEEGALRRATEALTKQQARVVGVRTDVTSLDSVQALASEAIRRFGSVEVLCNNAGVEGYFEGQIWEAMPADWNWTFGVNFWGVVHGLQAFMPAMVARGAEAHIVNTASTTGLVRGMNMYGISKHAVVALSEVVYAELAQQNSQVGVTVLCPGATATRLFEGSRNRPDEVGSVADNAARRAGDDFRHQMHARLQQGRQPSDVAEQVIQGIRDKRFYVVTDEGWDADIKDRMDDILARRDPLISDRMPGDPR
jgi:NAD(P)-dependent dehydrogenase (short-subunit alcohol dehydrogenase family)